MSAAGKPDRVDLEGLVGDLRAEIIELKALIVELRDENASLRARNDELERRLRRDSRNSSQSPSQDPPKSRAERRREAREKRGQLSKSKRKPGGQPGHEGSHRQMASADRVDRAFEHLPERCACGHAFNGSERPVGDPVAHQKWELPQIAPRIFEHRLHRLCCPDCGKPVLAGLPAGVSGSAFGPAAEAHIATLAGVYRLSRRQTASVMESMFHMPISLGGVDTVIMRMSKVLEDPWQALHHAVRQAEVVHADETSWIKAGENQWLWVAASALCACYRIDPHRSRAAAKELLGEDFGALLISDRYAAYRFLDVLQQQICYAHLIRQVTEISQTPGAAGKLGGKLLRALRKVIAIHRAHLEEDGDLGRLKARLAPLRSQIKQLLTEGSAGTHQRTARFCAGLISEYEALWTFCDVMDAEVPITNNAAERALRHAVIMRKTQHGTQSDRGNHWIERILSVNETCRLQGRAVLDYLTAAASAAHHGRSAPSLLPP